MKMRQGECGLSLMAPLPCLYVFVAEKSKSKAAEPRMLSKVRGRPDLAQWEIPSRRNWSP